MFNNKHLPLEQKRNNALEILKQWEIELELQNEVEKNTNLTKIQQEFDESNENYIILISNNEFES